MAGDAHVFHVVPHTHWDREWYLPVERFRFRLVRLIRTLLEILEKDPAFTHFHLDGQTIVLEDFLEIDPGQRERLARHIGAGRISVGPWYILPDEFLVSGEALVRNLRIGMDIAEGYGAVGMVGYLPDMFGHVAQMPQIMRGFGFESAFLWRGVSGGPDTLKSELLWEGADGSELFAVHFPDQHGYANGKSFGFDLDCSERILESLGAEMIPYATTRHFLLMNGVDHMEPKPTLTAVMAEINSRAGREMCRITPLADYWRMVRAESRTPIRVKGELRSVDRVSGRLYYDFILAGVLSSRMYLKLENYRVQTLLEKWAEPFSAIASLLGERYPGDFLLHAWKTLLKTHPHDDICGCSTDEVHLNDMTWFLWAGQTAGQIADDSLGFLARSVDAGAARPGELALVVFNPHPWPRSGIVSAAVRVAHDVEVRSVCVRDAEGGPVDAVLLAVEEESVIPNEPDLYPPSGMKKVKSCRIAVRAEGVPGLGWRMFFVTPRPRPDRLPAPLGPARAVLQNELIRAEIRGDGTLDVLDRRTGRSYQGVHALEDGADAGNEYAYSRALSDSILTSKGCQARIACVENDPLRVAYEVSVELRVPESLSEDALSRLRRFSGCSVSFRVSLDAGSPSLDFETVVDNTARDHRLRFLVPTRLAVESSWADSAFDVMERPVHVPQPSYEEWTEDAPVTFPMQNFVTVSDGASGVTVATRGLPEYEVTDDEERAIAVTLLRCVGELGVGRGNLALSRPTGPDVPVRDAQCMGLTACSYSIIFHPGDWRGGAMREALQRNVPLRAVQPREGGSAPLLPASQGFFSVEGGNILLSSLTHSPHEGFLEARVFNPEAAPTTCRIAVGRGRLLEARRASLRGEPLEPLAVEGASVSFEIKAKKIETVLLKIQ